MRCSRDAHERGRLADGRPVRGDPVPSRATRQETHERSIRPSEQPDCETRQMSGVSTGIEHEERAVGGWRGEGEGEERVVINKGPRGTCGEGRRDGGCTP